EPAETGSTAIPVSLLKAAKTNLCRVSSLDEYTTIFCCAIAPVLAQIAPKLSRSATPSEVEAKGLTMPLLATPHDPTRHCRHGSRYHYVEPSGGRHQRNRTKGDDRRPRAARNQNERRPAQQAIGDPDPAFFLHLASPKAAEQPSPSSSIGGSCDAPWGLWLPRGSGRGPASTPLRACRWVARSALP